MDLDIITHVLLSVFKRNLLLENQISHGIRSLHTEKKGAYRKQRLQALRWYSISGPPQRWRLKKRI